MEPKKILEQDTRVEKENLKINNSEQPFMNVVRKWNEFHICITDCCP